MRLILALVFLFSLVPAATGQPFLVEPKYAATSVPVEGGRFVWHSVSGATRYAVTLGTDPYRKKTLDRAMTTDTTMAMPPLQGLQTYYWFVEYYRGEAYGGQSMVSGFITTYTAPDTPDLTFPEPGAAVGMYILADSAEIHFEWMADGDAAYLKRLTEHDPEFGFRLQASTDSTFESHVNVDTFLRCGFSFVFNAYCVTERVIAIVGYFRVYETYFWRVRQQNAKGKSDWTEPSHFFTVHYSSAEPQNQADRPTRLEAVYPNPVFDAATLRFFLRETDHVELHVYDALGSRVVAVFQGVLPAGEHEATMQARGLAAGLYTAVFRSGGGMTTKPFLILN